MAKAFASAGDLAPKKVTFEKLADGVFACTAEGDPNTGVIVGDNEVLVFDAQATPVMAKRIVKRIRRVTKKPIKYVVLSHYHAVRALGASGFGAQDIITSEATRELIAERGAQDFKSEADVKGLQPTMIIVAVNDRPVRSVADWEAALERLESGSPVKLDISPPGSDQVYYFFLRAPQ